ncbi:penicillin-binding protein [Cellulomonas telluris]|uniref:penicillin-binding protein n=1 Tax=Cellulomonas telluris TaxID=2306636 RepID=UPI0010A822FF|nr:transglycosylase domain-containing protein [Cellulomonas telluris]
MPTPARARGRKVSAVQALGLLVSFLLVAVLGGVLAAGLLLPGVAAANSATDLSVTAFEEIPDELEQRPLPEKSEILAADGTLLATFYQQNREVKPLAEIAPIMQQAVIAVEDRRFYEHSGVDVAGMARAAVATAMGKTQGASTLTQQYVKNVLVDAAELAETQEERQAIIDAARESKGAEGVARKLREAKIAITLEQTMTKDEILEKYLNIAPFGASVYGVESAARYYFGKSAKDINYLEAATIAGITQSPSALDPVGPADEAPEVKAQRQAKSEARRNQVLKDMAREKYITADELAAGLATPIAQTLNPQPLKQGCMGAGDVVAGSGFFCDYVTKVIANDPVFGETRRERNNRLYRGGLTIRTTLDPVEQTAADQEVKAGVPVDDPSGVASAIVTVEPGTGKILAMAQNRNFSVAKDGPHTDTAVNYSTSFEYGGSQGFAPGSTFKVFTLLEWLKKGHSLNETVNGSRLRYEPREFQSCIRLSGEAWEFGNSEGGRAIPQSVLDATRNSVNSAYVAMAKQLNLCDIMQGAADIGVTQAGDPNSTTQWGTPGNAPFNGTPANVLGSDSTSPLQIAAAYATFASNGTYCRPIAITSVTDTNGEELPVPSADCRPGAIDPQVAAAMNYALSNVWTGTAKSLGRPAYTAAGKTGTTTGNENTWFAGYNPLRATAVWVGYSENFRSMNGQTINGQTYWRGPYGSSIAAPTWKRYMDRVMADKQVPAFAAPNDRQVYGERSGVPSVVGQSEQSARAQLEAAGFRVSVSGEQVSSSLPPGTVAEQSPSGRAARGTTVTLRLSSGQPPAPAGGGQPQPGFPFPGQGDGQGGGQGGNQGGGQGGPGNGQGRNG